MLDQKINQNLNYPLSQTLSQKWISLNVFAIDTLTYPGFWKLAAQHADQGTQEVLRSILKPLFVKRLQRLIPDVTAKDLIPPHAGSSCPSASV